VAGELGSDIGSGNPPGGFLPLPDVSGLEAHYKPAYIKPVVESEHTSIGAVPFVKNIQDVESDSAWDDPKLLRTLQVGTLAYWTSYVYSAFQAERDEDFDIEQTATKGINTHGEFLGGTPTSSQFGPSYTGMCCIFVESLDDGFGQAAHRITVAHEIAHTLGVDHGAGLMGEDVQTNAFSAESLVELRAYEGP